MTMETYECPNCHSKFHWRTQQLTECPYCIGVELIETTPVHETETDKAYTNWKDELQWND
jgi:hypothetical protein